MPTVCFPYNNPSTDNSEVIPMSHDNDQSSGNEGFHGVYGDYSDSSDSTDKFSPPFQASGRWDTLEKYQKRRIFPLKGKDGSTVGFRPMIQQGKGASRVTHSTVFRISPPVDEPMAMAMAQEWRDRKEVELGMGLGQISAKSAARFAPGISLVVSKTPPYRAYWKWTQKGHSRLTSYMSSRKSYSQSYNDGFYPTFTDGFKRVENFKSC